jgi:glycosyltransferase involved in cell wall biosynthesis
VAPARLVAAGFFKMSTMISVIVPVHNEQSVIERCLDAITGQAAPGEFEVIVVCNGCDDATATIAARFGPAVRVIETDVASKTNALNLGDAAATGFPRIYLDADVVVSTDSIRKVAGVLQRGEALAAAPWPSLVFRDGTGWAVRSYFAFWTALPYIEKGLMIAGVYAVSKEGRARFGSFPDVISDDGYFRLHFTDGERVEVADAPSRVTASANMRSLIKIRTRHRLGALELKMRFPQLFEREARTKHYLGAFLSILRRPRLYPGALPYLYVNLVARYRAKRQFRRLDRYVWERDDSTR